MNVSVKSFLSHKVHKSALTSISLALSQTPAYTAEPKIKKTMHCAVCLFTFQLSLVLIALTHGGMARLSPSGWIGYIPRRYTRERSPISVLNWL